MEFVVEVAGTVVFDAEFSRLGIAESFFRDNVLDLGLVCRLEHRHRRLVVPLHVHRSIETVDLDPRRNL